MCKLFAVFIYGVLTVTCTLAGIVTQSPLLIVLRGIVPLVIVLCGILPLVTMLIESLCVPFNTSKSVCASRSTTPNWATLVLIDHVRHLRRPFSTSPTSIFGLSDIQIWLSGDSRFGSSRAA